MSQTSLTRTSCQLHEHVNMSETSDLSHAKFFFDLNKVSA